MKWFKHSGTLRHDPKVKRVVREFGADGWTVYTVVVEAIADSLDPISKIIPFLEEEASDIAYEYKIDSDRVRKILDFCIKQGLFEESTTGFIFCFKLYKYVDEYFTKKQKNKEIYAERNKQIINAYKTGGIAPMLLCLKELAPNLSDQIGQIKIDANNLLQSNSIPTPEFLPQEEIRREENREEENKEKINKKEIDPVCFDYSPSVIPDNISNSLSNSFQEFVDYRKDIKSPIKTNKYLNGLLSQVGKEYVNEEHLIQCIDYTMRKEWKHVNSDYVEYKHVTNPDKYNEKKKAEQNPEDYSIVGSLTEEFKRKVKS